MFLSGVILRQVCPLIDEAEDRPVTCLFVCRRPPPTHTHTLLDPPPLQPRVLERGGIVIVFRWF